MRLRRLTFKQFEGSSSEWAIDSLTLQMVNLIVGRNATGKSMTVNMINGLATLLAGRTKAGQLLSAHYEAEFVRDDAVVGDDTGRIEYELEIRDRAVVKEVYTVDGRRLMTRGEGGKGQIDAIQLGKPLEFQAPLSELAVVLRRDSVQHPFLEEIHVWAESVLHYQFGTPFGKDRVAIILEEAPAFDIKDTLNVLSMFRQGRDRHQGRFVPAVIADMKRLGYDLEDVGFCVPNAIKVHSPSGVPYQYLFVKEAERAVYTEQFEMSQGMFRALALMIDLNFAALEIKPACFLIDDIGEGLDFERSCRLIDVLIEKASDAGVQLIMATNDRFVMNRVDLRFWTVLSRNGHGCDVRNYENSKEKFDYFSFTGMNNFDLLATNFLDDEEVDGPLCEGSE